MDSSSRKKKKKRKKKKEKKKKGQRPLREEEVRQAYEPTPARTAGRKNVFAATAASATTTTATYQRLNIIPLRRIEDFLLEADERKRAAEKVLRLEGERGKVRVRVTSERLLSRGTTSCTRAAARAAALLKAFDDDGDGYLSYWEALKLFRKVAPRTRPPSQGVFADLVRDVGCSNGLLSADGLLQLYLTHEGAGWKGSLDSHYVAAVGGTASPRSVPGTVAAVATRRMGEEEVAKVVERLTLVHRRPSPPPPPPPPAAAVDGERVRDMVERLSRPKPLPTPPPLPPPPPLRSRRPQHTPRQPTPVAATPPPPPCPPRQLTPASAREVLSRLHCTQKEARSAARTRLLKKYAACSKEDTAWLSVAL